MRTLLRGWIQPTLAVCLAACSGGGTEPAAPSQASITIVGAPATLAKGDTVRLSARVLDHAGNAVPNATVQWSSDLPAFLAVSSTGVVTARLVGTGIIRAGYAAMFATVNITVTAPPGPSDITILAVPPVMVLGDSAPLAARVADGSGTPLTGVEVAWSSESAAVLAVSATGWVKARQVGSGRIRATAGSATAAVDLQVVEPSPLRFVSLVGGPNNTCGFTAVGDLYCWGMELASGSSEPQPVKVGTTRAFTMVALGMRHGCALDTEGVAWCWGSGGSDQLGTSFSQFPWGSRTTIPVAGAPPFATVGVGSYHSCGLTAGGEVWCWGLNALGQLGRGGLSPSQTPTPAPVVGGLRFATMGVGSLHTCGLLSDGRAYCWGDNLYGELGIGKLPSSQPETTPSPVAGGQTFTTIAGGFQFMCGLTTGGAVYCWGEGDRGRLGNGAFGSQSVPALVPATESFVSLSVGAEVACATTRSGRFACWGNNEWGALGVPPTGEICPANPAGNATLSCASRPVFWPVDYLGLHGVVAGGIHACGLDARGLAYCWGANGAGQLGNLGPTMSVAPVPVGPPIN